jgi:hypothetical protein
VLSCHASNVVRDLTSKIVAEVERAEGKSYGIVGTLGAKKEFDYSTILLSY